MAARSHFRILGIPVRVEPFFLIVAVLFGMRLERLDLIAVWVAVTFVSILVHELGHAVSLKVFGQPSAIVLHGFGGVTLSTRRLTQARSIVVSLAGSLTALALLWFPARTIQGTEWYWDQTLLVRAAITFTAFANLWWSIANLLPIRPLDGGNVATELLGIDLARRLSIVAAAGGGIWAYSQEQTYAALFAGLLGFLNLSEIRAARTGARGTAFDVEAPELPPPRHGRRSGPTGRRSPLRAVPADPSLAGPPGGPTPPDPARVEAGVWAALRTGDDRRARMLTEHLRGQPASPFLPAAVALASGARDLALELYRKAYAAEPSGPPNLVAAELVGRYDLAVELAHALVEDPATGPAAASGLQTHLHYAGRYRAAAEVGEVVHAAGPRNPAQTAFEVACSWSRAEEADRAIEWLERAAEAGFRAAAVIDGEPDLTAVRAHPRWPVVRARLV